MTAAFLFQFLKICSFAAPCEAAAQDYALGYVDVVDAADRLQDYAIGRGLVSDLGQDSVQGIMAAASRRSGGKSALTITGPRPAANLASPSRCSTRPATSFARIIRNGSQRTIDA